MMRPLLALLVTGALAGCAARDEVRFDATGDLPALEFRRSGQLTWDEVTVRCADGVPPVRFALVAPHADNPGFLSWNGEEPRSKLDVVLDSNLVLTAETRCLFVADGETMLLLPHGQALRLVRADEPVTHERYVGRLPEGGLVEVDVWFAAEAADATIAVRVDGVPALAALHDPNGSPPTLVSDATFGNGRPTTIETFGHGMRTKVTLDAAPPIAELEVGNEPAIYLSLRRQP